MGLLLGLVYKHSKSKHYSMQEDSVIEISLENISKPKALEEPLPPVIVPPEPVVEEPKSEEDLFGAVEAPKIAYTKEQVEVSVPKVDEKVLTLLKTKSQPVQESVKQRAQLEVSLKQASVETNLSVENKNRAGIKDEYIVKINALLTQRWQNTTDIVGGVYRAIVRIFISLSGRFDYSVLQWSNYAPFDQQLKRFLDDQKERLLDAPPTATSIELDVNFISKDT